MGRRAKKIGGLERPLKYAKRVASQNQRLTTSVTFSGEELAALAEYVAAGLVLLRVASPHRAVSKFKAAMSRLKIPVPRAW